MPGRSALLLPALGLLASCDREPSFDQRYKAQSDKIHVSANSIETEVTRQLSGAAEADKAAAEASSAARAENRIATP
jgi:regulator of protease activity HflC (stomatin/prohibitin superfamily)